MEFTAPAFQICMMLLNVAIVMRSLLKFVSRRINAGFAFGMLKREKLAEAMHTTSRALHYGTILA